MSSEIPRQVSGAIRNACVMHPESGGKWGVEIFNFQLTLIPHFTNPEDLVDLGGDSRNSAMVKIGEKIITNKDSVSVRCGIRGDMGTEIAIVNGADGIAIVSEGQDYIRGYKIPLGLANEVIKNLEESGFERI